MASFVPHYKKKLLQLQELEGELMALIQSGAKMEKISIAVEEVRSARIRAIKEKIAKLAPSEKCAPERNKLQTEIEKHQDMAALALLDVYRRRVAVTNGPVTIPRAPRRGEW